MPDRPHPERQIDRPAFERSLVAIVRIWTVFPFQFDSAGIDWETITRWLLVFGIAGTAIGFVAGLVALVRSRDRGGARG